MKKTLFLFATLVVSVICINGSDAKSPGTETRTVQSSVCTVADPTGTPLNVRSRPKTGRILSKLKNGTVVKVVDVWAEPGSGDETSEWSKITRTQNGKTRVLGWVLSYYLNCN